MNVESEASLACELNASIEVGFTPISGRKLMMKYNSAIVDLTSASKAFWYNNYKLCTLQVLDDVRYTRCYRKIAGEQRGIQ